MTLKLKNSQFFFFILAQEDGARDIHGGAAIRAAVPADDIPAEQASVHLD